MTKRELAFAQWNNARSGGEGLFGAFTAGWDAGAAFTAEWRDKFGQAAIDNRAAIDELLSVLQQIASLPLGHHDATRIAKQAIAEFNHEPLNPPNEPIAPLNQAYDENARQKVPK